MVLLTYILALLWTYPLFGANPVIATVNGTPIYESQLKSSLNTQGEKPTLERLILYELAIQEAHRQKIDQKPEVRAELDRVLYKHFLKHRLSQSKKTLDPSESSVKVHYQENPLLRIRHLVLLAQNPKENQIAKRKLKTIQKELKKGSAFKKLVLKYSQDASVRLAGDLDYRGIHNFPPVFYNKVKSLKVGEISPPFFRNGAIHLFELMDRKTFHAAPASYRLHLKSRLRRQREMKFLAAQLEDLKKRATIKILANENLGTNKK